MDITELLEKLKYYQQQRQIAVVKGLNTKMWDEEIKKLEDELTKLDRQH